MITRIVLDVLKPRSPSVLEFASAIADKSPGCSVRVTVDEVDEKTESTIVEVQGHNISFENLSAAIDDLGGSVHSIDEVEINGAGSTS